MRISRRRRGLTLGRPTLVLGGIAVAATGATAAVELGRVWRRGETLLVVREGYRVTPDRENALFNMAAAFGTTLALARIITHVIRTSGGRGVLRNVRLGDRHIHHFVPGILLGLGAGGTSIAVRSKHIDRWLALPFGAGAALILDEAALLLELEDVYWSEEGVLSLQASFGVLALLASLALGVRVLKRGEQTVPSAPLPDTG